MFKPSTNWIQLVDFATILKQLPIPSSVALLGATLQQTDPSCPVGPESESATLIFVVTYYVSFVKVLSWIYLNCSIGILNLNGF